MSLAVSAVAPGRQRILRGVAVTGVQVVLSLGERLVSEEGRAAISQANIAESQDPVARSARVAS